MEVVIFIGIPGSGKSSFYKDQFFHTHLRINLDMLKTRIKECSLLSFAAQFRQKIVIDNTNVRISERKQYIDFAKLNKFKIIGYYFQVKPETALERNKKRVGKSRVEDKVIFIKQHQLQEPAKSEGFDELFLVESTEDNRFNITEWKQ